MCVCACVRVCARACVCARAFEHPCVRVCLRLCVLEWGGGTKMCLGISSAVATPHFFEHMSVDMNRSTEFTV